MRNIVLLAAFGVSLVFASNPVRAADDPGQGISAATEWSAAKKQSTAKQKSTRSSQARSARGSYGATIGCGYGGCGPVPRGCTVTAGMDWYGNYSGEDEVICGRR